MNRNITNLYTKARFYKDNGFHLLPVGKNKRPVTNSWAEYQKRQPTPDELEEWFQEQAYNIGIVTGKPSGVIIVDVDVIKGGDPEPYKDCVCYAKTVNGGYHFYYAWTEGIIGTTGVLPGVDLRSDGNYVVAPPSIGLNAEGKPAEYVWMTEPLGEVELQPFPKGLFLDSLVTKRPKLDFNEPITSGGRNAAVTSFIGSLIGAIPQGEWDRLVLPAAIGYNKAKCEPPQEDFEVVNTYKSLVQKELRKREMVENKDTDLNLVSYNEIVGLPEVPTKYLVDELIVEDTVCMLSGESGIGKTWIYLDLAVKLATGGMLFDKYKCEKVGTLILDKENKMTMIKTRLAMLTREENLNIHLTSNQDIFINDHWVDIIITTCQKLNLRLVVFDSLRRFFMGNENDSGEINQMYRFLHKMREAGLTVILIHHHNKGENKSPRGSTDLVNQLDIHLSLEKSQNQLRMTTAKTRWFPPAPVTVKIDTDTKTYFKLVGCGAENVQVVLKQEEIEVKVYELFESGLEIPCSTVIKSLQQQTNCSDGMVLRALNRLVNTDKLNYDEGKKMYRRKT